MRGEGAEIDGPELPIMDASVRSLFFSSIEIRKGEGKKRSGNPGSQAGAASSMTLSDRLIFSAPKFSLVLTVGKKKRRRRKEKREM